MPSAATLFTATIAALVVLTSAIPIKATKQNVGDTLIASTGAAPIEVTNQDVNGALVARQFWPIGNGMGGGINNVGNIVGSNVGGAGNTVSGNTINGK